MRKIHYAGFALPSGYELISQVSEQKGGTWLLRKTTLLNEKMRYNPHEERLEYLREDGEWDVYEPHLYGVNFWTN